MGLRTLPNGMEYFSISEELSALLTLLYEAVQPWHLGIFAVLTTVFVVMIVFFVLASAGQGLEALS